MGKREYPPLMESHPLIEERVSLCQYCTLRVGGSARYFARAASASQIPFLLAQARERHVPVYILGGGSNILCTDATIEKFFIKMEESGIHPVHETSEALSVEVAAGTRWDDFVVWAVARGTSGTEALSAIPGTVGAAPVQNIGAYGQEVKDTIARVRAYDTEHGTFVDIPAPECQFDYRTSVFKTGARGRFVITSVLFKLSKELPRIPRHPDVERYFADAGIHHPAAEDVRRAIITIRRRKLPDPAVIPNAGSFFTNPLIPPETYEALRGRFHTIRATPLPNGTWKVSAGWLIEQCGFKGKWMGNAGVYGENALVLVGNGTTTYRELIALRDAVIQAVRERFGITLQMEPEVVE